VCRYLCELEGYNYNANVIMTMMWLLFTTMRAYFRSCAFDANSSPYSWRSCHSAGEFHPPTQPALYRPLHLTKRASVESTHTPTHQRLSSQGNGDTLDPISVGLAWAIIWLSASAVRENTCCSCWQTWNLPACLCFGSAGAVAVAVASHRLVKQQTVGTAGAENSGRFCWQTSATRGFLC